MLRHKRPCRLSATVSGYCSCPAWSNIHCTPRQWAYYCLRASTRAQNMGSTSCRSWRCTTEPMILAWNQTWWWHPLEWMPHMVCRVHGPREDTGIRVKPWWLPRGRRIERLCAKSGGSWKEVSSLQLIDTSSRCPALQSSDEYTILPTRASSSAAASRSAWSARLSVSSSGKR